MNMETTATDTRRDLENRLIQRAWKDPHFKKEVVSNPKGMLERYLGKTLPADLKIMVHEEDAQTLHFSIPVAPSNLTELNDEELARVAGGTDVVIATLLVYGTAALATAAVGTAIGASAADTVTKGW